MDFAWTVEQQQLYERMRQFARDELACGFECLTAAEGARVFETNTGLWRKAARSGLAGLCVSSEHGGGGFDCLTTARVLEAIGHGCPDAGFGFALAAHLLACCVPIDRHGTAMQRETYLPRLCSGEWIGANAITEPESGSDAFALRTRAVKEEGHYVLTGRKVFISNAPVADVFLVYAATDPGRGLFGLSAFLIEAGTPGLTVEAPVSKGGLITAQMAAVRLDECRVPACQRLGGEGAAGPIFHESMGWERNCLFALWVGAMERQLAEVIEQAMTRCQFGRPIGTNQAISHRIADMKLRLEAARLMLYRACWERAQGRPSDLSTSLAKLAVSEAFLQSSLDAVQIFGGSGILRDRGIERYVRDALPGTIYSGSSEMQRELIARALGLPARRRNEE